jgi:hypothetical protein
MNQTQKQIIIKDVEKALDRYLELKENQMAEIVPDALGLTAAIREAFIAGYFWGLADQRLV